MGNTVQYILIIFFHNMNLVGVGNIGSCPQKKIQGTVPEMCKNHSDSGWI